MENKFLLMLGADVPLNLVNLYLNRAKTSISNLTGLTLEEIDANKNIEDLVVDLALYRYNLNGSEGLASESYEGQSFHYRTAIPDFIKSELRHFKKMRMF